MIVRVRIHGRVQGVWFRAWTVRAARKRGLSGWVRNRSDGTVEALFSGPEDQIEEMLAACHRGSTASKVSAIDRHSADETEVLDGDFQKRPTV